MGVFFQKVPGSVLLDGKGQEPRLHKDYSSNCLVSCIIHRSTPGGRIGNKEVD